MTTWKLDGTKHHILICNGSSCLRNQGEEVTQAIRDQIARNEADSVIHTTRTRCNGRCEDGCVAIVYPQGSWYGEMTPDAGRNLVNELLSKTVPALKHKMIYAYDDAFVASGNGRPGTAKSSPPNKS